MQQSPGVHQGFDYARSQKPTRFAYERCLADLESGTHGFAFASGMAAITRARKLLKVVDNTFSSPFLQRPLEYVTDIVVHSATKYLNGHSDVVGGGVVVRDDELARRQMQGFGGMITFFIKGGIDAARRFLERCELFALAESLGG